jgi:hypothetical protein
MARLLALAVCLALAAGACSVLPGPTVLVFDNRSAVPVALYPDAIVGPCSTMEFDRAAIDHGKAALDAAFRKDGTDGTFDSWVPAGAVHYQAGIPGRRIGATEPTTVVVSALPLRVEVAARVPEAQLPPCGGDPVGIQ